MEMDVVLTGLAQYAINTHVEQATRKQAEDLIYVLEERAQRIHWAGMDMVSNARATERRNTLREAIDLIASKVGITQDELCELQQNVADGLSAEDEIRAEMAVPQHLVW